MYLVKTQKSRSRETSQGTATIQVSVVAWTGGNSEEGREQVVRQRLTSDGGRAQRMRP